DRNSALRFYYRYDRAAFEDWHYDGLPLVLGSEAVFLGAGPRSYSASLVGPLYQYAPHLGWPADVRGRLRNLLPHLRGDASAGPAVSHRREGHDRSRWRGRRQRRVLDLPVRLRHAPQVTLRCLDRRAVHRVEIVLARRRVAPEHVGLAVAVLVAHGDDLPREVGNGSEGPPGRLDRRAIHRIEIVLAAR